MTKVQVLGSVLFGVMFVMFGMLAANGLNPEDIASPYLGGWFFEHGAQADIYGFPPKEMFSGMIPQTWLEAAKQADIPANTLYPFVYPPIWAALLGPVTKVISFTAFSKLVYLVHFILIYLSMVLAWRLSGRPGVFIAWAMVVSAYIFSALPSISALAQNQPQILVVFLLLLGLERLAAGHSMSAGVILALAATLKITPVLLIVLFIVKKDWRGFWAMVATGAAVIVASFSLAGIDLHLAYLAYVADMGNVAFISKFNWSFASSLYQLSAESMSYPLGAVGVNYTADLPPWISVLSTGLLLLGVVYWLIRVHRAPARLRPIVYAIFFIWIGFFGPLGWPYYYLPVLFLWPAVIFYYPSPIWRLFAFAMFIGVFRMEILLYIRSLGSAFDMGQLYGAAAVLAVLLLLVIVQWRAFKKIDPV